MPSVQEEISEIKHKDKEGNDVSLKVEPRSQDMPVFDCTVCRQRIRQENYEPESGPNEALLCECCQECACHIRCFSKEDAEFFEEEDIWVCAECESHFEDECLDCCEDCYQRFLQEAEEYWILHHLEHLPI